MPALKTYLIDFYLLNPLSCREFEYVNKNQQHCIMYSHILELFHSQKCIH